MPSYYDLPAIFGSASVEDVDKFNSLPFYLAMNEVALFKRVNIWDKMYGSIDWEPNMGDVMKGITPQPSPVGNAFFFPQNITSQPKKDIYETAESVETARVKWHRYESKQFYFLPYFRAFWKNQIQYTNKDIVSKIQISNNLFIRTNIWYKAPQVYLAGFGLVDAPVEDGNIANDAGNSKNNTWLAAALANVTAPLSLRVLHNLQLIAREDINMPGFDGQATAKDNQGQREHYVMVDATETFDKFYIDPDLSKWKTLNLDLLFEDFQGMLFGKVTYKFDPFPLRILRNAADGSVTIPAPQVINATDNKIYVNPDYKAAQFQVGFLCGADAYKSIKVGPPPSEFAAKNMSASKFYSLRWNGEVQLTDQILIETGTSAGNDLHYELNRYGTNLQFISQALHGCLAGDPRYVLPVIYLRQRVTDVA